jgi:hypothetical protein
MQTAALCSKACCSRDKNVTDYTVLMEEDDKGTL